MIACPHCQRSVEITEQHYGTLFTCPHCNAVYFIDWGGRPELAVSDDEAAAANEEAISHDFASSAPTPESNPGSENNFTSDYNPNDYSAPVDTYQLEEAPAGEQPVMEASPQDAYTQAEPTEPEPTPYDFGQTLDQMNEPAKPSIADTSDFSDVTDFANDNNTVGSLAYTVIIEGIDSSRLVSLIKEAMTDARFNWDVSSLIHQIGGGKLTLEGLSPAKAATLVQRLKYLPLKISWRQDVLSS